MNRIQVYEAFDPQAGHTIYMARNIGPHATEVKRLFGTDTLPTAFFPPMKPEEVVQRLQTLNPGVEVFYGSTSQFHA